MMFRTAAALAAAVSLAACTQTFDDGAPEATAGDTELAATAVNVFHATWKGAQAGVWFGDGLVGGGIDVFQGTSNRQSTAYVNFSTYAIDPTSEVCTTETYCVPDRKGSPDCTPEEITYCWHSRVSYVYGWGEIPTSQFVSRGTSARLHTTVDAATFTIERCTVDQGNGEEPWTCTQGGAGGEIDVTWSGDRSNSFFSSGVTRQNYGRYSYSSNGTYSSIAASADGALFGMPFLNAGGSLSNSKNVSISKDVTTNPDL